MTDLSAFKDLKRIDKSNLSYFVDPDINVPHAFTTRLGGVSTIPYLSQMNMGFDLGDELANVEKNYHIICRAASLSENTVHTKQVHGNKIMQVDKSHIGKTFECDGFVTDKKGVTLCIRTADCVPILFCFEDKIIGACHAGWRGTSLRIAPETVDAMCRLGATSDKIKVAVGTAIHKCCYTVGDDFCTEIRNRLGADIAEDTIEKRNGKLYADIVAMNVRLLTEHGIKPENISVSSHCTSCESDTFFSHRAMNGKRGVMAAMICI